MKQRRKFGMKDAIAIAILAVAVLTFGQSGSVQTAQPDPARVLGVWRATLDGLPAFTLSVTNESGELQGAILFYLIKREKPGEAPTATPGAPGPIFHPVFDGTTLRFEVSHKYAHPPRTLHDPPVLFELTLDANGQAVVQNKMEGMTLRVTHSDY